MVERLLMVSYNPAMIWYTPWICLKLSEKVNDLCANLSRYNDESFTAPLDVWVKKLITSNQFENYLESTDFIYNFFIISIKFLFE